MHISHNIYELLYWDMYKSCRAHFITTVSKYSEICALISSLDL